MMAYYVFVVEKDLMAWEDVQNMPIIGNKEDYVRIRTVGASKYKNIYSQNPRI